MVDEVDDEPDTKVNSAFYPSRMVNLVPPWLVLLRAIVNFLSI